MITALRNSPNTLLGTLIALQVIDFVLTYIGVSKHGLLMEGNPIVRAIMTQMGIFYGLLLCKGFAATVLFLFFIGADYLKTNLILFSMLVAIFAYSLASVWWIIFFIF
jgi:hypothetical protein